MKKAMPEDHPSRDDVEEALERITHIADSINQARLALPLGVHSLLTEHAARSYRVCT